MILKTIIQKHREQSNPDVCDPRVRDAPLTRGQFIRKYTIIKEHI